MRKNKKGNMIQVLNAIYPPILLIIVIILFWEAACITNNIPTWQLAKPTDIGKAFVENFGEIVPYLKTTYFNIIVGFVLAVVIGVLLAVLISSFSVLGNALTPLIVALCCVPMITLVPTLMLALGTGNNVKILTIVIQAFPIINMNATTAFLNVDPTRLELMQSLKASRLQKFRYCILQDALPGVFTGIKLGCIMAVLGGVSAEIIGGNTGLGNRISYYIGFSKTAQALSCVLYIVFIGALLYALISILEKKLVKG